jgi:hypothetical protein
MRGTLRAALAAVLLLTIAPGCVTSRVAYTPEALRQRVAELDPTFPASELVVPFELPPEALEAAHRAVVGVKGDDERVQRLVKAFFTGQNRRVEYDATATTSGADALAAGRGNCLALASIFIGLARAIGLDAQYVDLSSRVNEMRYGDGGTTVNMGHVSAMVVTGNDRITLDFMRLGPVRWYKPLDDLEALAHYYNNLGYELIDDAAGRSVAPDWVGAARYFRMAVAVKPTFARAWNNLGIAAARQGHRAEAAERYRQAIELDPRLPAPLANLGALQLQQGDLAGAMASLERAASLEPGGAHIQYQLAVARLRSGDKDGAIRSLRRTLSLRGSYPGAQALLEQLAPGSPGAGGF